MVTAVGVLMLLPFIAAVAHGWFLAAAAIAVAHDMLDRLDGAVRSQSCHDLFTGITNCHGGQGESLVPPYTRGSVSLCVSLPHKLSSSFSMTSSFDIVSQVAMVCKGRGVQHDGHFGSFLDAMCDKVFGCGQLLVFAICVVGRCRLPLSNSI